MKKLLTLAALVGVASLSYGQGYVEMFNGSTSNVKTNGATVAANAGGTLGAGFYYELLYAPAATATIDSSLSGWTAVSTFATGTNTATSGRFIGTGAGTVDSLGIPIASTASGQSYAFAVVGWSANLGSSWANVFAGRPTTLVSGVGNYGAATWSSTSTQGTDAVVSPNGTAGGWYGISLIAPSVLLAPSGGPYNNVIGPATSGQIPGWNLNYYSTVVVPEPATLALAGLGAAAMLIFRRRK